MPLAKSGSIENMLDALTNYIIWDIIDLNELSPQQAAGYHVGFATLRR